MLVSGVSQSDSVTQKAPIYEPSSCTLSKTWPCVPSTSGVSEIVACSPSPIADDPQLYHLPPLLPPPVSNSSCLFTRWQPVPQLLY